MRAKLIVESTKIKYKGTDRWVNSDDLEDKSKSKLFVYSDSGLKNVLKTTSGKTIMVKKSDLKDVLKENIGGGGGAGYAVYGGGWGRSFGNPSMGGRFGGRGFGFGGSSNLGGGPNIMYTYEVKPLNRSLEPLPSEEDFERKIHVGSLIKGTELGKENELTGKVINIVEDDDNNIKYYEILDDKSAIEKRINPTSIEIYEPYEDNLFGDDEGMLTAFHPNTYNESFYPTINEKLSLQEQTTDVKEKIERSKKIPKELKDKLISMIVKAGIHGTKYNNGVVTYLRKEKVDGKSFDGVGIGADKDGFFVFTHRARSKSKPELNKIPDKDINFIKSTG